MPANSRVWHVHRAELDDSKVLAKNSQSRIVRIARGSGRSVKEVNELLEQFKHFEKVMKKVKGLKLGKVPLCLLTPPLGRPSLSVVGAASHSRSALVGNAQGGELKGRNLSQMSNLIPPHVMKQMGGMGAIQNMMRSLGGGGGGLGGLGGLGNMMGLGE